MCDGWRQPRTNGEWRVIHFKNWKATLLSDTPKTKQSAHVTQSHVLLATTKRKSGRNRDTNQIWQLNQTSIVTLALETLFNYLQRYFPHNDDVLIWVNGVIGGGLVLCLNVPSALLMMVEGGESIWRRVKDNSHNRGWVLIDHHQFGLKNGISKHDGLVFVVETGMRSNWMCWTM